MAPTGCPVLPPPPPDAAPRHEVVAPDVVCRPQKRRRTEDDGPLLDVHDPCLAHLTEDQRRVPAAVAAGRHCFVTGRAGSGKTATLAATLQALDNAGVPYAATAATGIASVPLEGTTLHAQLCMFDDRDPDISAKIVRGRQPLVRHMQVLVIDEISMVAGDVLQKALDILTLVRKDRPPGRVLPVVVMVGDFLQLPPVKGQWVFQSQAWALLNPVVINLGQSFRQQGPGAGEFLALLDEAREGYLSRASIRLLRARVGAEVEAPPSKSESGSGSGSGSKSESGSGSESKFETGSESGSETETTPLSVVLPLPPVRPVVLLPRRAEVDAINRAEMAKLVTDDNPVRVFTASVSKEMQVKVVDPARPGDEPTVQWVPCPECVPMDGALVCPAFAEAKVTLPAGGGRRGQAPPDDVVDKVVRAFGNLLTPVTLGLCVGAQVIFTANIDPPTLINGTRGVVTAFDPATGLPLVTLASGTTIAVGQHRALRPVGSNKLSLSPAYVFTQVPLMAAWALTIHKSQGMSLDVMEADLGPSVFAKGQAYVALSRARTLEGITLRAFCPMAIRADETVLAWYETQGLLSRGSVDEEPLPPPLPENLNRSIMRK